MLFEALYKEEALCHLSVALIILYPQQHNKFSYSTLVKSTATSLYQEQSYGIIEYKQS